MTPSRPPGHSIQLASRSTALRTWQPPPAEHGDTWILLKRNRNLVLRIALGACALVIAVTLVSPMEFKASSRLFLGELGVTQPQGPDKPRVDISGAGPGDMGSEVEILKSESLVTRAILHSGLNVDLRPAGWSPPRYLRWRISGRDPRILSGASDELAVSNAYLPRELTDREDVEVEFRSEDEFVVLRDAQRVANGKLGAPVTFGGLGFTLNAGSARKPAPGARYTLRISPLQEVTTNVLKTLAVTTPKVIGATEPVKVVTLEYSHRYPQQAASFLASLMTEYLQQRQAWKAEEGSAAEKFVAQQLKELREELDKSEKKLADYRSNSNTVVVDGEAKSLVERVGRYEEMRVAARLQAASLGDMKKALKNPNASLEAFLQGESGDSVLTGLGNSLSEARTELAKLEQRFNAAAPDVREQRAKVDAQLRMVQSYVNSKLSRTQENMSALSGVIGQAEKKLRTVPGAELGLQQLARESEVRGKLYSYLLERQQEAAIAKASKVSRNRVLDAPLIPSKEDSPRLALRLASLLIGLLGGVVFVLARHALTDKVQTEGDAHRSANGHPIAATIPDLALGKPSAGQGFPLQRIFDLFAPGMDWNYAEAFRTLRASLTLQPSSQQHGQVVLITSPSPGDGKTTCAFGLAAALAAEGKFVLLIDADVRKPSHHIMTGRRLGPGLSDVMRGRFDWKQAMHRMPVAVGEFFFITAGEGASPELLSADAMAPLFASLRTLFDWIVIDMASFPLVSDALSLGPYADHVISVVRLGHTSRSLASQHVRRLAPHVHSYRLVVNGGTAGGPYGVVPGYNSAHGPQGTAVQVQPPHARWDVSES